MAPWRQGLLVGALFGFELLVGRPAIHQCVAHGSFCIPHRYLLPWACIEAAIGATGCSPVARHCAGVWRPRDCIFWPQQRHIQRVQQRAVGRFSGSAGRCSVRPLLWSYAAQASRSARYTNLAIPIGCSLCAALDCIHWDGAGPLQPNACRLGQPTLSFRS